MSKSAVGNKAGLVLVIGDVSDKSLSFLEMDHYKCSLENDLILEDVRLTSCV